MKRSTDTSERDTSIRADEQPRNISADESKLDQTLADSFPASDAPPWTLGVTSSRSKRLRKRERQS